MSFPYFTCLLAIVFLVTSQSRLAAQAPPANFTADVIRNANERVTVVFTLHPIRHPNFAVLLVQADGSIVDHVPLPPRTYYGLVRDHPGAIACGWLRPDGTLFARVAFEDGAEWISTGGNASVNSANWQPAWPTTVITEGGAGSVVYSVETGVDLPNRQLVASGGTPDLAVGMAEYSVMSANYIFLRDAAIVHRIGRVVIRMAEANDPYQLPVVNTNTLLDEIPNQWNNVLPVGNSHRVALVAHPAANGNGLASVGAIGNSPGRYSSNGSNAIGDFSAVWRHEVGHNWSASHYEGGGRPEGPTIMSDNTLPRFSSSELAKIIAYRNNRLNFFEAIPAYPFPLPPRANLDRVWLSEGGNTTIDVLANDSDSNGEVISILSFDATCSRGGIVTRVAGAGPGGRDVLNYVPNPEFQNGTGFFRYRLTDTSGRTATGYVIMRPAADSFQPLHHWTLDETSGSTAVNATSGPDGTHVNSPTINQPGATVVTGRGVTYDGTSESTTIPALGLTGNSYTFTAWIRRSGTQSNGAPILFTRNSDASSNSYTGLYLSNNQLRVRWNGQLFTPNPTLSVPNDEWCLAAFSVSPAQVAVHLRTAAGLITSTHDSTIAPASFLNPFLLARSQPTSGSPLYFGGSIDDVRIFPGALSAAQVGTLYTQAAQPPNFSIINPEPAQIVNPEGTRFIAGATQQSGLLRSVEYYDLTSGFSYGTDHAAPFALAVDTLTPGPRTLGARASFGDWGYQIEAAPVPFTVLATTRPVVTLTASSPPSFGGSGTRFTFRRDSSLGALEVPFTLVGTAVRDSDYTIPGNAVAFAAGQSVVTLDLTPAAAPSSPGEKNLTLALTQTGDFVIEAPSTATVVFADSVRSVASGNWNQGSTWSSGLPAPTTGVQGSGPDYLIMPGHSVRSFDETQNSQTLRARSLRVSNTGRLDLARTHASTLEQATYDIPRVSLDTGGVLRFIASVGSSGHNLTAPIEAAGNATVQFSGGVYEQFANLSGAIFGSGNLTLQSVSDVGSINGDVRTFSVLSATNPYSGDWSIEHTPAGNDFGALRAAAINALGSGGVTVRRRSSLINDSSGGLDSLRFITLQGQTSSLVLNQPTQASAAALTVSHASAEVVVGNAASAVGSLAGTAGSIRGTGVGSLLVLHQSNDATFSGSIGANLRLRKQGPARLSLTGAIDAGTSIDITAGALSLSSQPRTIAGITQSGGKLELPGTASPATPLLTVTGTAAFTGGNLEVTFAAPPQLGVPYQIVAYGSLEGIPQITVTHPGAVAFSAVVQPGTGTNSVVTATFVRSAAALVWRGNDPALPNRWDTDTTVNWNNAGTPDRFLAGDSVTFDDSAASFTPQIEGSIEAQVVNFAAATNAYSLTGPGSLATGSVVKSGAATATIGTANTFTGPVTVTEGRLRLANAAALGASVSGAKAVTVSGTGQLDLNGFNNSAPSRTYTLRIGGSGPDGSGAVVNSGAAVFSNAGMLHLELLGNATLGGTGRFDVGIANGNPTQGLVTGNGHTLFKTGTSQIMLRGDASATPISIDVQQGILGLESHNAAFGGSTGQVTVRGGAVLGVWGARTISTPLTLAAGATLRALGGGAATWTGPITLSGVVTIDCPTQPKTISGQLSGAGGFTKTGSNLLTLSGNHNYTGNTTVAAGTLVLDTAFLADSSSLSITGGAILQLQQPGIDIISALYLNGVQQAAGTYHAGNSSFLTGNGALQVTTGPPPATPYDAWLVTAGLVPGAPNTGPGEHADGSGVPNLLQFALGGNPANAADNGIYRVFDAADGVSGTPVILTIAVRGPAAFAGNPSPVATMDGVTLTVSGSLDLADWTAAVEEVIPAFDAGGTVTAPAGYGLRSFRFRDPLGEPARGFLRVKATAP